MNGPGTEVQRTYNGTALEGVEISRRISLKSVLSCGDGFEMFFAFLHLFSSILNKVNQPEINLIVMLLRLSTAYILPYDLYITASLSLSYMAVNKM